MFRAFLSLFRVLQAFSLFWNQSPIEMRWAHFVIGYWDAEWRENRLMRILVYTCCVLSSRILCCWFNRDFRRCWPTSNFRIVFQHRQTLAYTGGLYHRGSFRPLKDFFLSHGFGYFIFPIFHSSLWPWYLCLLRFDIRSLWSIYFGVQSTCRAVPLRTTIQRWVTIH